MDDSLLRAQQGGSHGAQLRSLAIAQCEMGLASEKQVLEVALPDVAKEKVWKVVKAPPAVKVPPF